MSSIVLFNLVELVAITTILHRTKARADAIVIVGLVLVYLYAAWNLQGLRRTLAEFVTRVDQHFIDLKAHLGIDRHPGDVDAFEGMKRDLVRTESHFAVDMIFRATEWLVAVWYLWSAL